jgi:hypothetical protein
VVKADLHTTLPCSCNENVEDRVARDTKQWITVAGLIADLDSADGLKRLVLDDRGRNRKAMGTDSLIYS